MSTTEDAQVQQLARLLLVKNKWRAKAQATAKAEQDSRAAFEGGSGARRANILKNWNEPTAREQAAKDVVVYIIFVLFFTADINRSLMDNDVFYFGRNIEGQFVQQELGQEFSPTWGKTFEDLATVEQFYQWLQGPFAGTLFTDGTREAGSILRYGTLMGGIRISQLRVKSSPCTSRVPVPMQNYEFTCYGATSGALWTQFAIDQESTEPFSEFGDWDEEGGGSYGPFQYNGQTVYGESLEDRGATTVEEARSLMLSDFTTKLWNTYPSPAFAVDLAPTLTYEAARKAVGNLVRSRYIDLHTKAVFVCFTVYNPMLDRICHVRLVAELTKAGGLMVTHDLDTLRMWDLVTSEDYFYLGITGVVCLFYLWFMSIELRELRKLRWKYLHSYMNQAWLLNFMCFTAQYGCRFAIYWLLPSTVHVADPEYIEFLPAVRFRKTQVALQAMSTFLIWFGMIAVLSYSPNFAIMSNTLARSAKELAGFGMIFFIVFFGFAQSYTIVFHGRIEGTIHRMYY
jgi:hypothetical protein